jgi:hypothetical protein
VTTRGDVRVVVSRVCFLFFLLSCLSVRQHGEGEMQAIF